jgi:hypothetical protein
VHSAEDWEELLPPEISRQQQLRMWCFELMPPR